MTTQRRAAFVAVLLSVLAAGRARAQTDYRNLDDDRPVRTEDAYVTEHYAFEFTAPYRYERSAGTGTHMVIPELTWGLFRDTHLGLKLPFAVRDGVLASAAGLSGARLFAVHTLWTESAGLPAVAVRSDLILPVGAFAEERPSATFKAIATRAFGRTRLHANAAFTVGRLGRAAYAEPAEKWWVSLAVDRTILRSSLMLVAESYLQRSRPGVPVELDTGAGLRWQWTTSTVIDLGAARRLRSTGPDLMLTVGLTHAFAIPAFMPGGAR